MSRTRDLLRWSLIAAGSGVVVLQLVPPIGALLLGVAIAMLCGAPAGAGAVGRHLLALSVAGLGFGVDLTVVWSVGLAGLADTILLLGATFTIGYWLARRLGVTTDVALLVTAGTAICGGSAIAAVAPLIRARAGDVATAVGVVFALNGIALLVFPALGAGMGIEADAFGKWCALAIHDTSSVVGAAMTHSAEALEVATVTKLTRMLWIVPIGALIVWRRRRSMPGGGGERATVPWFLLAFVVAAGVRAAFPGVEVFAGIAGWAPVGMTGALFAIGLCLTESFRGGLAGRTLVYGLVLWLLLAGGALWLVTATSCVVR